VDAGRGDQPTSIAVDAGGNAYFAGNVPGAIGSNILLVKLDPGGQVLWSAVNARPYSGAGKIAVDASGAVYVPGSYWDVADQIAYALLAKYDGAGALVWERTYGHGYFQNWWREVAIAGDGGVLVTGGTYRGGYDVILARYDGAGTLRWTSAYDRTDYVEYGYGLGGDARGNAYLLTISFTTVGPYAGPDLTAITKYDPSGRALWSRTLEGRPGELALTPAGELLAVAGNVLVKLAPVAP
jgi:hypothetical protein